MSCERVLRFGVVLLAGLATLGIAIPAASAQASFTASRRADLSAFGGVTGTYTGFSERKNAGITAGVDLSFRRRFGIVPSLEVRGTIPFDRGRDVSEKDILGGARAEFLSGRLRPYVDFLAGRGEISYNGYSISPLTRIYGSSLSNVLSPGGGIRYSLRGNLSVFGDAQFQRWDSPVSASGHLTAKPFTAGVIYRFAYGHRRGR
jgi:hypothetical protein